MRSICLSKTNAIQIKYDAESNLHADPCVHCLYSMSTSHPASAQLVQHQRPPVTSIARAVVVRHGGRAPGPIRPCGGAPWRYTALPGRPATARVRGLFLRVGHEWALLRVGEQWPNVGNVLGTNDQCPGMTSAVLRHTGLVVKLGSQNTYASRLKRLGSDYIKTSQHWIHIQPVWPHLHEQPKTKI